MPGHEVTAMNRLMSWQKSSALFLGISFPAVWLTQHVPVNLTKDVDIHFSESNSSKKRKAWALIPYENFRGKSKCSLLVGSDLRYIGDSDVGFFGQMPRLIGIAVARDTYLQSVEQVLLGHFAKFRHPDPLMDFVLQQCCAIMPRHSADNSTGANCPPCYLGDDATSFFCKNRSFDLVPLIHEHQEHVSPKRASYHQWVSLLCGQREMWPDRWSGGVGWHRACSFSVNGYCTNWRIQGCFHCLSHVR